MKIQIINIEAKNNSQLAIVKHTAGQSAVKHAVQAGQKITLVVDGVTLNGTQEVAKKKVKLVRVGQDLVVESIDGSEQFVELTNFYAEQDVALTGDQWVIAESAKLEPLDGSVVYLFDSNAQPAAAIVGVLGGAGAGAATASIFTTPLAIAAGSIAALVTVPSETPPSKGPAAIGGVAVAEAAGGINATEAASGGGVPVQVTLPANAAIGDVITVSIDGSAPVRYTVTANDINPTLNPGGTVSVLLPTSAITAAGEGAATITTSYADAAGNPAANSPVTTTGITIDTVAPSALSVAVPEAAGGINAEEAASGGGVPVQVTLPANAAEGDVITVSIDGGTPVTHTVTAADVAAMPAPVSVLLPTSAITAAGEGPATITTTYADAAGNPAANSPVITTGINIDTQGPAAVSVAVPEAAGGGINVAEAASGGGVPVQVTLPANAAEGDVITVSIDGGTPVTYTVTAADVAAMPAPVSVLLPTLAITAAGEGPATITTTYADAAGNPAANSPVTTTGITIDTVAPSALAVAVPEAAGGINAAEAASGGGVPVQVTLPANAAEGDVITVSIDGGTPVTYTVTAADVAAMPAPVSVLLPTSAITAAGEGAATITTTYADAAGNPAANSPVTTTGITIDTAAPTAPVVNALTTNDTTPVITGTATLLAGESLTVVVNGATYNNVAVTAGIWSLDTDAAVASSGALGLFEDGQSYDVTATVTDTAGNSTSDASSNEITIDTQPSATPAVALHQDTANGTDFVTSNGTLDVTGLDVGATWQYSLDGITWQYGNGGNPATGTTDSFVAAHGTYTPGKVQVRQTDAAGNASDVGELVHPLGIAPPTQLDGLGGQEAQTQITAMADGGYVVTWIGYSADYSVNDVFVQRYGNDNVAQGTPLQLDALGGQDEQPQITAMADGGYVVTWIGYSADYSVNDVFVQRYGNDNVAQGTPHQLNGLGGQDQAPQITAMADGGYVVTWFGYNANYSVNDVFVQRYGNDNVAQGTPHQLNGLGGQDTYPQITAMTDGGYVVTWTGRSADGSVLDVFVQRYDSNNLAQSGVHQLDGLGGQDETPQITAMADGGYVVTWFGYSADYSVNDVFVQRYGNDNVAQGTPHQLNGLGGQDTQPQITAMTDGGYVVTWCASNADQSVRDVFVQSYGSDNVAQGTPHQLNALGGYDWGNQITALADGGYVVTWSGYSANYSVNDVFVQRYGSDNVAQGTPHQLNGLGGQDAQPQITAMTDGGYVVTWSAANADGSVNDLLVQRFDAQNNLWSTPAALVIDTEPPTAPTVEALTTNDTTPVITGTATLLLGERLTVTVNGATYNNVAVNGTGQWSLDTGAASVSSGTLGAFVVGQSYNVTATVTDAAGNSTSDSSSNEITVVDTLAPNAPAVALRQDTADGTDFVTSNGTLDVTGLEVGATWQYSLDGGNLWQDGNSGNPTTGTSDSFVAPHGIYAIGQVLVKQTDAFGNTSNHGELALPPAAPARIQLDGQGGIDQTQKVVAMADGGYVVSWQGWSSDFSSQKVFVQRYGSNNLALGSRHELDNLGASGSSNQITALTDGGYVVTWQALNANNTVYDVFVQRYGSDNVAQGTPHQLNGLGGQDQEPQIIAMADGGYVVTWSGYSANYSVNDVFVQRYGSDNVAQGTPHQLNGLGGQDAQPQITAMTDGGYVVTWSSVNADRSVMDIFVQRYGSDNVAQGTPHLLEVPGRSDGGSEITAMADGGYVVAWNGWLLGESDADVFIQRFNNSNVAQGAPLQLDGLGGRDLYPEIIAMADGGYVVTWQAVSSDGSVGDVFLQRYGSDNVAQGSRHTFDALGGYDSGAQIIAMADGGYVVAWSGANPDNSVTDIFVQRYNVNSVAQGSRHQLDDLGATDVNPQITGLADGGYLVTWMAQSGGTSDIVGYRFDAQNNVWNPALPLVVDTAPPTAPVVNALTTNNTTPVITGTATLLAGESLTVVVNGATYNNVAVDGSNHWSINTGVATVSNGTLGAFADGLSYSVLATVTDTAGNSSSDTSSNEISIDTQTPGTPTLVLAQDLGSSSTDLLTSDGTINVSGLEVGATWQYSLDGGNNWQPGNGGAVTTGTTDSFVAATGSYGAGSVLVKQTDVAGNTSGVGVLVHPDAASPAIRLDGQGRSDGSPQIAALNDGGYVVTWSDRNANGSLQDVFVQRFGSDNAAQGSPQKLDALGGVDAGPQITALTDGGYVVTWQTSGPTPADPRDVFVQRFDSGNAPQGGPQQLDALGGIDSGPQTTALVGGDYVVTWGARGPTLADRWDVFVQRFSSDNTVQWTSHQLDAVGGSDTSQVISAMPDGGYVVSWTGYSANFAVRDLFIQRFGSDNTAQGPLNQLDGMGGEDIQIQITALNDGGYVVTWQGLSLDGSLDDIFVQGFDSDNNAQGPKHQFDALGWTDSDVHVSALIDGGYVVTWQSMTSDGQTWQSFVQRFDSNSMAQGAPHRLFDFVDVYAFDQTVTALNDGGYVVAYRIETQDFSIYDLMVQRFASDGAPQGRFQLHGLGATAKGNPELQALTDGGYVLSWQEAGDIVVQRFDVQGRLWTGDAAPLVVDTQPPASPMVDAVTSDSTPTITGTATLLGDESLTVTLNGAIYTNVVVDGSGQWRIDTGTATASSGTLGAFANGQTYSVTATVTDAAGNSTSDTSSNELTIDTFVATPSLVLAHDLGGSSTDLLTADGTINVSGLEVGATWQYSLDGGNSWLSGNGGAAATATTGSFVASAGSYGASSVLVKQTDAAGNASVDGELVTTTTAAQRTLHVLVGEQNDGAKITGLTDGGYVVGWRATNESGHTQIFTQRYDSANRAVGAKQALPTYGVSDDAVKIAATVDGGYVAVWRSDTGQPGDTDVFMQRFDANNAPVGSYTMLSAGAGTYDGFAEVVALENAGVYAGVAVAWMDGTNVFVQGIDANGAVVGTPNNVAMINSSGTYHLTALSGGGYAVSGLYRNGGTESSTVFLFDAGHTAVYSTNFGTAATQQTGITSLDDGGYVMVHNTTTGVFFSRFDASGQMSVVSSQLRSSTGIRDASVIDLNNANGDYLVCWIEWGGSAAKVFAQRVDGITNTAIGALAENQGEATSSGIYNFNAVTLTGGGYVLAWTEYTATQDTETFFQQYDANGATTGGVQHLQGWHNATADYPSVLTALSDGGFAISWTGHDGIASEILTQRFDASGNLMPETLALTVDNTDPTLLSSSPADEGTVGANANISLSFSENIALGSSGHVLLKNMSGGLDIDIDLANPAGQLSVVENKLVINPSTDLTVGHSYAVHLDAGAVTDAAGNDFAGIANDTTLNFVAGPPSELHLGTVSGIDLNLIGGFTTSGGQRYYYLDLSNDGTAWDSFADTIDHNALDTLFNGGPDTVDTQPGGAVAGVDDARTVLVGGYTLVLPTEAELTAALAAMPNGSNQWSQSDACWSATQTGAEQHTYVHPMGFNGPDSDTSTYVVAIQVVL